MARTPSRDPMALSPSPTVAGQRADHGWHVWVMAPDACDLRLTAAQARRIAVELNDMCDVIEGTHPALVEEGGSASLRSATAGTPPQGQWGYSE